MILAYIQQASTAKKLILSASRLASQLGKDFAVLTEETLLRTDELLEECGVKDYQLFEKREERRLINICETQEVSFLFIQLVENRSRVIRRWLSECRELRIPYVLYKNGFEELDLTKVIVPVNFLEEEVEKAQFASAFGRFCGSEITLLIANDYGSKAANNAARMQTLFEKFDFTYTAQKATKDSFKVEMEAVQVASASGAGLAIVSASRDYGLDDIIFGPKELHLIKKSDVPLLLVNPRGDLYALCD